MFLTYYCLEDGQHRGLQHVFINCVVYTIVNGC